MRFLVRLNRVGVPRGSFLGSVRGLASSLGVEVKNPKWTSYGGLELDIFCPSNADFDIFVAALAPIATPEFTTDLSKAQPHMSDKEILSRARSLFNGERYWECHEILEGLWRQKQGEEKRLLQGIILVCAAFVHHQKGEDGIALGVLGRASRQLDYPMRIYSDIDLDRFRAKVLRILTQGSFGEFRI